MKYRWIVYTAQNIPGNVFSDLSRHSSLRGAATYYREFCEAVGTDECSAALYAYTEGDWREAKEFEDSGCPFDYPDRIIERGPMGGVKVERA